MLGVETAASMGVSAISGARRSMPQGHLKSSLIQATRALLLAAGTWAPRLQSAGCQGGVVWLLLNSQSVNLLW